MKYGNIDYLVADYLAEVTMGILAKRRGSKHNLGGAGQGGYVAEFVTFVWKPLMQDILGKGIKVVTNAGGLDPCALKLAIEECCSEAGLQVPIVAAVCGDDLSQAVQKLKQQDQLRPFSQSEGNVKAEPLLPPADKNIESFNAYLGADPIRRALDDGAQVVVTGRVVDSAIVLGPLMHEFKWSLEDYDLLAAGSLAGHIIECGCQATGGNFTDWRQSAFSANGGWSNMGFPIVECSADGTFIATKAERTGGIVTVNSVAEQMIYEIGDPSSYILPDVVVDLRNVNLEQIDVDRVRISNVKGRPPTSFLKVSGIYMDGYKVTGEIFIGGLEARDKALAVGNAILTRVNKMIKKFGMSDFRATNVEALGAEHTYGSNSLHHQTREVVLRLSAHHDDVRALRMFLMEIAPSATCMAPGIIGVTSGRPRPTGNMVHFASLVRKDAVKPYYVIGEDKRIVDVPFISTSTNNASASKLTSKFNWTSKEPLKTVRLIDVCIARSGDKGDSANIGVICRKKEYYPWLLQNITVSRVQKWMAFLLKPDSEVKRFELPGIGAVNFILTACLGGGGLSSLQVDRQGKTFAQMLLSMPVQVPQSWISEPFAKL